MGHVSYPYETKYMFFSIFILKKITINKNFENGITFWGFDCQKFFFLIKKKKNHKIALFGLSSQKYRRMIQNFEGD